MFPPCAAKPMPMRTTERKSFIKDFSPYLYAYPKDTSDKSKPYSGYIMRGTTGDPMSTFAAIGNAPKGVTRQKGCVNQIDLSGVTSVEDQAKLIRLQLDNCANQFILNSAIYPFHKAGSNLICGTKDDPYKRCSQEDMCQPLQMKAPGNEYEASTYIKAAWKKLLNDPSYRKTMRPACLLPGSDPSCEPHLPTGITLNNTDKSGTKMPSIQTLTLANIAASPYEEIIDPSHPFSPRWDFDYNEREFYSPFTAPYMSKYYDDEKAVYCAGVRGKSDDAGGDSGGTSDSCKDEGVIKVDVLSFRRDAFNKAVMARIGYNTYCYNDRSATTGSICQVPLTSWCWTIKSIDPYNWCNSQVESKNCWECFGLNGKVDDEKKKTPPCTTRYDGNDRSISKPGYFPGGLNAFQWKATCTADPKEIFDKKTMSDACQELRAPYTPLNKLKMRYHNPKEKEDDEGSAGDSCTESGGDSGEEDESSGASTVVLKGGVQEGLWHKEYFGNHMPYPRLWDVGNSIQKAKTNGGQNATDDYGMYTAVVGVGREGEPGEDSEESADGGTGGGAEGEEEEEKKKKDERCLYGGWGGDVSFGGLSISTPDPVTSWTELKLYQAYTTREQNVVCLGRYEKAFKYRSSENQALLSAGSVTTGIVKTECDVDTSVKPNRTKLETCKYIELNKDEKDDAAGESVSEDGKKWTSLQYVQESWPLPWVGYMSDPDSSLQFPNLPGDAKLVTGLDNAQCGDIILMPYGAGKKDDAKTRGIPKVAHVICEEGEKTDKNLSAIRKIDGKHYIEVLEADNGKWPDVCGTTSMMGEMKTRKLFKPGEMREVIKATLENLDNWTTSCADTMLTECEMEPWDELKLYRPVDNLPDGDDGKDEESGDE